MKIKIIFNMANNLKAFPAGIQICHHCEDIANILKTVREIQVIVEDLKEDLEWLKENESHASDLEREEAWEAEDDSESEL